LLRFRSLRRLPESNQQSNAQLFDEMLTVDTMLELIRPISEGLALFAEYDISPGASSVISTPLLWTAIALLQRSELTDLSRPEMGQCMERLLSLRLTPASLRRKMGFLSRSLSEVDDVYFDGYMTVKRLYLDLSQIAPALADPDLFLSYLRCYLFEDYGMVAILAGEHNSVFDRLVAMIERFGARLENLYRLDLRQDVAIFERFSNRRPNIDRSGGIPGLGLTPQELQNGLSIQKNLLIELEDELEVEPTIRKILNAQRGWLSRRSLAYVASEPARIRVAKRLVSAWPDPPDDEYPILAGASAMAGVRDTEGTQRGWISLILQPASGYFAAVIGIGGSVVAVRFMNAAEPPPEVMALFSDPQCSPAVVELEHNAIEAWVDGYYREAPEPLSTYIATARQSTECALGRIAESFIRRWGKDGDACLSCLRGKNRLQELFGQNQIMFETFVALGILRTRDVLSPSMTAELLRKGWDSKAALLFAVQLEEKGVSFVRNDQGIFRWLV
jgi:hypothetical protein